MSGNHFNVRTFAFQSEFPTLTRDRVIVLVRHFAMRGDVRADMFIHTVITRET